MPFCAQIISDIFCKPVHVSKPSGSIGLGTFLISAIEMGIYKNLDEAAKTVVLPGSYKPDKQNHQVYNGYFKIFEKLSTRFFDGFEEISNLQQINKVEKVIA
jgi:gluconokinase